MLGDTTQVLTAVGALATAIITGAILVLGIVTYRHNRDLSGRRRPVIAKRPLPDQLIYSGVTTPDIAYEVGIYATEDWDHYRIGHVFLFNHSDATQVIVFTAKRSRIIWPRSGAKLRAVTQTLQLEPHIGGLVPIVFRSSTGEWPADEVDAVVGYYKRTYVVALLGLTVSRRKVRHRGRILLRPYDGRLLPSRTQ